jgi:hypothetical protein
MDGPLQTAWPSSFPELVTERLRLRAPSPRDASAVLAVVGDSRGRTTCRPTRRSPQASQVFAIRPEHRVGASGRQPGRAHQSTAQAQRAFRAGNIDFSLDRASVAHNGHDRLVVAGATETDSSSFGSGVLPWNGQNRRKCWPFPAPRSQRDWCGAGLAIRGRASETVRARGKRDANLDRDS